MLNLILSNTHIVVTVDPDLLFHIDRNHPALNVMLNCNQFDILFVSNLINTLINCDYVNTVQFIADLFFSSSLKIHNEDDLVINFIIHFIIL